MKTKNNYPSSEFEHEDKCPSCGSPCNIHIDLDDNDECNECRNQIDGLEMGQIIPKEELKQETLEEAAFNFTAGKSVKEICSRMDFVKGSKFGAKWQQEQEQSNENSWFNEYQKVEDYIIKRIGDKFLEASPEKYNTASEATIALLENNWKQEQDKNLYSEEDLLKFGAFVRIEDKKEKRLFLIQDYFKKWKQI